MIRELFVRMKGYDYRPVSRFLARPETRRSGLLLVVGMAVGGFGAVAFRPSSGAVTRVVEMPGQCDTVAAISEKGNPSGPPVIPTVLAAITVRASSIPDSDAPVETEALDVEGGESSSDGNRSPANQVVGHRFESESGYDLEPEDRDEDRDDEDDGRDS